MNPLLEQASLAIQKSLQTDAEKDIETMKEAIASLPTASILFLQSDEFRELVSSLYSYCMESMFSQLKNPIESIDLTDEKMLQSYQNAKLKKLGASSVFTKLMSLHETLKVLEVDKVK